MENKHFHKIAQAIKSRSPIHYQIPTVGKIIFTKVVPYLFVYRIPHNVKDRMLADLTKAESASIIFNSDQEQHFTYIAQIASLLAAEFGSCLLIELWTAEARQEVDIAVHLSQKSALNLAEYLVKNLQKEAPELTFKLERNKKTPSPPDFPELLPLKDSQEKQIYVLGLSIQQRYLDLEGNELPMLLRQFRESIALSLSRLFFEFLRIHTSLNISTFKQQRKMTYTPSVLEIDRGIMRESQRFDFLLLVTPINVQEAWKQFKANKFHGDPKFKYRPMPIDPDLVKRNLFNLRIEDIQDPTIAYLYRDKRQEMEYMMTMLGHCGKPNFRHGSLQVFGNVSDKLFQIAQAILTTIAYNTPAQKKEENLMNAEEFAALARQEIQYLQTQNPDFNTAVRIRNDISGVMVNRGILNISADYRTSKTRALALIQHEVGTHILTYYNGKKQPIGLFSLGVPGYEELQEGLAVLAEYLVGGLTNERLKIIAARVVAVRHMLMGNRFSETFLLMKEEHNFSEEVAFKIAMRVHRGGGLTKDAVYLKGLLSLINYLQAGNDLSVLTLGKIRQDYLPIIEDLLQRGLLLPPALTPRYFEKNFNANLTFISQQGSIFNLIN